MCVYETTNEIMIIKIKKMTKKIKRNCHRASKQLLRCRNTRPFEFWVPRTGTLAPVSDKPKREIRDG